jgi:lactoylglutathione lyase
MQIPSFNLVVISSTNFERATRFYEALGLSFTKHRHGTGPEHLTCELGFVVFEIYPRAGEADSTASTRIGFKVSSVDEIVKQLEQNGVTVISPPKDSPWGRRAVVNDFDGHRVELTE